MILATLYLVAKYVLGHMCRVGISPMDGIRASATVVKYDGSRAEHVLYESRLGSFGSSFSLKPLIHTENPPRRKQHKG